MKRTQSIAILFRLSWRSVWKNKRRTILTLLSIMIGCAMIIFMRAFQLGGYEQMIRDAVENNTGHLQIHNRGFYENQTLEYVFQPQQALLDRLSQDKRIAGFGKRVQAGGLLVFNDTTAGALIQGVEPDAERRVSTIDRKMVSGRYLQTADSKAVIVGETLAKNLGVKVGDTVALSSQGFDGSFAAEYLRVVGIFRTLNPEYDLMLAIMPLSQAMQTFSMSGYISSIAISLRESRDMQAVRDDLRALAAVPRNKPYDDPLEVMGWDELLPEIVQYIAMDKMSSHVFVALLYLVVAFGILNTIQMSVFERIREFGVMLALGTRPGQVRAMVIIESFLIGCIGSVLGMAIGAILSWYFQVHPLDFSDYVKEMQAFGMATMQMPARYSTWILVRTALMTIVLAIVFAVFPARRAASLKPIEAIRHL